MSLTLESDIEGPDPRQESQDQQAFQNQIELAHQWQRLKVDAPLVWDSLQNHVETEYRAVIQRIAQSKPGSDEDANARMEYQGILTLRDWVMRMINNVHDVNDRLDEAEH